jgi:hypothetical protein
MFKKKNLFYFSYIYIEDYIIYDDSFFFFNFFSFLIYIYSPREIVKGNQSDPTAGTITR